MRRAWFLWLLIFGSPRLVAAELPVLLDLGSSLSVVAGQPLIISLIVYSGGPIISYEWLKDGTVIDGQTTAALQLGAATASMAGRYRARVTNAAGSTLTSECVVTVVPATPPRVTRVPLDQTVFLSEEAKFSVEASGSTPLTYEWRRDGVLVFANTVDNTFDLLSTRPNDAGTYTVTARNVAGASTSSSFKLKIIPVAAPVITRHPTSQTAPYNQALVLDATVTGAQPWTSTWRKDGVVVAETKSGAPRLLLNDVAATPEKQAGSYTVTVTNRFGSMVSDPAVIAFEPPVAPMIQLGPFSQAVTAGTFANLTAIITGSEPFTYQWRKDGVAIEGAVGSSFQRSNWTASDAGRYTLVVRNAFGTVETEPAVVRIRTITAGSAPPVVESHPSIATALAGSSTSFVVRGRSYADDTLTYQWQRDGQAIAGATKDALILSNVSATDAADYRCVITDRGGSVTSHAAHLYVLSAPANGFERQSGDRSCAVGGSCEFDVVLMFASGDLYYRRTWWRTNPERQVSDPTVSASFTVYNATSAAAGDYFAQLEVFDRQQKPVGTYRTALFHLEVRESAPEIARHPENWTVRDGGAALLDFDLSAPGEYTYQWYRDGAAVPGATKNSLFVDPVNASNVGAYTVTVTNTRGSVTSEPGHLKIFPAEKTLLTSHPASVAVPYGGSTNLSVVTSGGRIYKSYPTTWYHNGVQVAGETAQTLSISSVRLSDEGPYYAVVHSPDGDLTSRSASLAVLDRPSAPAIVSAPIDTQARPGQLASLAVAASGSTPLHYSWYRGADAIPNSDRPVLTWAAVNAGEAGDYHVVITNDLGSVTSSVARLQVTRASRIANLSARVQIGTGDAIAITGFVVRGSGEKRLLLRGIGPALADAGLSNAIKGAQLGLHDVTGRLVATNRVWPAGVYPVPAGRAELIVTGNEVGAFPITGYTLDAALIQRLESGAYSVHVEGLDGASGIGLVEIYDADREGSGARLVNLSCRADVGTGDRVAIAGLVIDGEGSQRVLLRAAGPALLGQGVTKALAQPRLELFTLGGARLAANEQWEQGNDASQIASVATQVGAFAFAKGSRDAALLVDLTPGVYSAVVSGIADTEGIALVEIYAVP